MMKRVLYLSNIVVPYRARILNGIAEKCNLTVLYERSNSDNRDLTWANSEQIHYKAEYLRGFNVGHENAFSFGILKYVFGKYDNIIVGCYNSPCQMFAMLVMKIFGISFIVNLDGEPFINGTGIKYRIKRMLLKWANGYLVAGEKSANSIAELAGDKRVVPYYFSSLSLQEVLAHGAIDCVRSRTVLVVGQYFDYKGLDVAIEAARKDNTIRYKFVGMGNRTERFLKDNHIEDLDNVEVYAFLNKTELEQEYKNCAMVLLPSRRECWGLVVNEAASYGAPIVSTLGSGAAVEFLSEKYSAYLAVPDDADDLYQKIKLLLDSDDVVEYGIYLKSKSLDYTIERCVKQHIEMLKDI